MIPLIEDNRDALRALCKEFHVARLEVFGSAADGTFDPATSDIDLLTPKAIRNPYFQADVNETRQVLYAA